MEGDFHAHPSAELSSTIDRLSHPTPIPFSTAPSSVFRGQEIHDDPAVDYGPHGVSDHAVRDLPKGTPTFFRDSPQAGEMPWPHPIVPHGPRGYGAGSSLGCHGLPVP